jgi:hypothetical protein
MANNYSKNTGLRQKNVQKFDMCRAIFARLFLVLLLTFIRGVSLPTISGSAQAGTKRDGTKVSAVSFLYEGTEHIRSALNRCLIYFRMSGRPDVVEQKKLFTALVENERYLGRHSHTLMRVTSRRSIELTKKMMATDKPTHLEEDKWSVPIVKAQLTRANATTHTLDRNAYIERHFSQLTMNHLALDKNIKIDVIASTIEEAFAHLKSEQFDQIEILPQRLRTDFLLILAFNSETGEIRLVVNILNGIAYKQEVVAQLLYYTPKEPFVHPIESYRIRILSNQVRPKDIFTRLLKKQDLNPDIVFFGYKTNFSKIAQDFGAIHVKSGEVRDLVYSVHLAKGQHVMSVNIEPQLFADRAGELVEAIQSLSKKKRTFVMVGTAGSLSPTIPFNSYVAPSHVRFIEGEKVNNIDYANGARALSSLFPDSLRKMFFTDPNIGQISVNSILFEDMRWARTYSEKFNPGRGDSLVEQEGYGIIKAAQRRNDHLLMVYRISDLPLANESFATTNLQLSQDADLEKVQRALLEMAIQNHD